MVRSTRRSAYIVEDRGIDLKTCTAYDLGVRVRHRDCQLPAPGHNVVDGTVLEELEVVDVQKPDRVGAQMTGVPGVPGQAQGMRTCDMNQGGGIQQHIRHFKPRIAFSDADDEDPPARKITWIHGCILVSFGQFDPGDPRDPWL